MTKKEFLEKLPEALAHIPDDAIVILENNNVSFLVKGSKPESKDMIFVPQMPWYMFEAIKSNVVESNPS
jgi:hypothetical protein